LVINNSRAVFKGIDLATTRSIIIKRGETSKIVVKSNNPTKKTGIKFWRKYLEIIFINLN